jgi:hypothetical protein
MKAILKRHQIVIFFALTFIISWYPWYTGGHGLRTWGPSLAGLIVVGFSEGRAGIKKMWQRLIHWRAGWKWWLISLFTPAVMILAAIGIHVLRGGAAPSFTFWRQEWYFAPLLMLLMLLPMQGPGGEEPFGFRGFGQPKLQEKLGPQAPLFTSLILGFVWGIWHLPEFFDPTSTQYAIGIGFLGPFIIMEIANSTMMTWIYNKTGGSVLLAGVIYHMAIDMSSTLMVDFTVAGMSAGETIAPPDVSLLQLQMVVAVLVALGVVIATKGRLGYSAKDETGA